MRWRTRGQSAQCSNIEMGKAGGGHDWLTFFTTLPVMAGWRILARSGMVLRRLAWTAKDRVQVVRSIVVLANASSGPRWVGGGWTGGASSKRTRNSRSDVTRSPRRSAAAAVAGLRHQHASPHTPPPLTERDGRNVRSMNVQIMTLSTIQLSLDRCLRPL